MPLHFTPISELILTSVPYKIKVRIARLWGYEKPDRPGVITGLNLILVDENGSRIEASLSQGIFRKYQEHLEEGACRLIMNFRLVPNQGNFRGTAHPYKISFIYQSVVKPSQDIPNLHHRFHFHPFDEIVSKSHDSTVFFDLIGEVIGMSEIEDVICGSKTEKTLRIKLRDLGDNVIDCTLWSKFAVDTHAYVKSNKDGPVVLIGSLMKTKKFNGKTTVQSNPFTSKLFFSSDLDEIRQFREGLGSSDSMVSLSQLTSSSISSHSSLETFPRTSYKTIAEILAETEDMVCVTLATIVSFYSEEPWFYVACSKCFKKASSYFNPITETVERDKHSCEHCDKEITTTMIRYMVKFKATDQTETATFVLFEREVVELVHKTAYELRLQQIQFNREAQYPQELMDMEGMFAVLKVKIKSSDNGYGNTSFQVLKLCLDRSEIEKFKEEADKKEASLDQNPGAISISSDPSAGNVIQEAILDQIPEAISQSSDHSDANAIQVPPIDQNPAALTLSSDHSASNSIERGNTSESRELNVMMEPFTPIPKRPLNVVVEDEEAQQSSTKRPTPQSVNKPKVFVKREKKN